MKTKYLSLIILLGIVVLSVNAGICAEEVSSNIPTLTETIQTKENTGITLTATKFIVTMIGVVISSIILWIILSIYNKLFIKNKSFESSMKDDVLNTPKTIEDAVTFFITHNKLK